MDRRRAISILMEEKKTLEALLEIRTDPYRIKELKERIQAYDIILSENIEFTSNRSSKEVKVVELVIKDDTSTTNSNKFSTKREKLILNMKKRIKKFSRELGVSILG